MLNELFELSLGLSQVFRSIVCYALHTYKYEDKWVSRETRICMWTHHWKFGISILSRETVARSCPEMLWDEMSVNRVTLPTNQSN